MTEWVTIKIPEETRDAAKSDPRTYQQIMEAGLENEPFGSGGDTDLDDLRESVRAIEERTGRIERAVEELGR